jgi:hypothetical protein
VRQFWFDLLGTYRVSHGTYDETERRYSIDLQAGVRYNSLRQTVDADVNVDIGPSDGFQTKLGGTEDWFEPVVGVRGVAEISDRWTVAERADFGGFGVNDDHLQWKVITGFDYRAWERTSVKFGWQFYGMTTRPTARTGNSPTTCFSTARIWRSPIASELPRRGNRIHGI